MMAHPVAVHQIHDERSAGGEGAVDRFEHGEIVLRTLEIAEGISQDADAVKVTVAEAKPPRIAFVKRDLQVALLGALAGQADQIAGAIEPGDIGKAAAGELERMAPLTAAQIEDAVVALEPDAADQQVDFIGRIAVVLDDVAVGFEVEGVEQGAPPVGRQVTFEIRDRTQSSRADAPVRLGMVEIRAGRAGVGQVSLGGGPRTVGFLPHIDLPRLSGNQKSGFPLKGEPPSKNVLSGGSNGIGAGRWRDLEWASGGQWPAWKGLRERSCRPAAARSAWSLKNSVPAWRTAEVGEKFGINASAFKAAFSARRNYSGRAAIRPVWDITAASDPRTKAESRLHGTGCNSIVPRRTPFARSMTTSCLPPSGSASARISRSGPAVIASMRAPRGMSIGGAANP